MKRFSKKLIFFVLFSSMLLPFIPTIAKAQDEEDQILFRQGFSNIVGDWDPAISVGFNIMSWYY
ncbi:MAG: hypothetical protein ACFFHD_05690 [Promethearchaeota archaeon]